ncbi:MAG: class I SAM-dependent methyltransferase [Xanthomonadales bacterium]|nr:class I SAM-dependent methyltransferase [Xanthomonadales bacterium]
MSTPTGSEASRADRHSCYQLAVQDVVTEIDFIEETWGSLRQRPLELLREDFCGTANTSCEWIRRGAAHRAIGVDLDEEVLAWGRAQNLSQLSAAQRERISLLQQDVGLGTSEAPDVVLAMNFSYYLLMERASLRDYFRSVRENLMPDGIFFLDAYGGYEAPMVLEEKRACDGFTYVWEQAAFNPIDSRMECRIHFDFADGSRMEDAFRYHWRLWTLPELQELLREAGFRKVTVYWEGTDADTGEGDGIYRPATVGDADPGWVCYLVAEK